MHPYSNHKLFETTITLVLCDPVANSSTRKEIRRDSHQELTRPKQNLRAESWLQPWTIQIFYGLQLGCVFKANLVQIKAENCFPSVYSSSYLHLLLKATGNWQYSIQNYRYWFDQQSLYFFCWCWFRGDAEKNVSPALAGWNPISWPDI